MLRSFCSSLVLMSVASKRLLKSPAKLGMDDGDSSWMFIGFHG